jgi:peptidoglycan/xylan/chitin deacetylase (PgdA/CDA1 family)
MYHSISGAGPALTDMQVRLSSLRQQLAALQQEGWHLVGLTEALESHGADDRVVALTFDDGYADFLSAASCLGELGARATLYIPTDHVGHHQLIAEAGRLLTWDEIAGLPRDVVEIGSHAHHHRPLDVRPRAAVATETLTSKSRLEDVLGTSVTSFCYPHGYSSPRVRRQVAAAGYSNACIVGRRIARPSDDVFALPRLHVTDDVSPQRIVRMVSSDRTPVASQVKRALQPGWRSARHLSRLVGHELT